MSLLRKIIIGAGLAMVLAVVFLAYPASGIPILAYHQVGGDDEIYSVDSADFEIQMRYLAEKGYVAVSLAEALEAFVGKRVLPPKPIVITFDDGYVDNLLTALPIMEKYGMKATVFVITGAVGQPGYLTWEQLQMMRARQTEIGSHTFSHAVLSQLTPEERRREIVVSQADIEQHLGSPVYFLAYPYGKFDKELFDLLHQAGYRGACSGLAGLNYPRTNPYSLKRINIAQQKFGLWEFRLRLARAEIFGKLENIY